MSVYEQRRALDVYLGRKLSADFVVAQNPDHPLLLRGPDVLVGGRGGLSALFCPTSKERRVPRYLLDRFALSRMALPSHTRCVLVLAEDDLRIVPFLEENFAATFMLRGERELNELSRAVGNPQLLAQAEIPRRIWLGNQERFALTYRISRVLRRRAERKSAREGLDIHSAEARGAFLRGGAAEISRITLKGAERLFNVDRGVPYPTGEPSLPIAAETVPSPVGDPDKYIRAAAFSGWALVQDGGADVESISNFLSQKTRFQ